jgi:hypothetical protein
MLVAYRIIYGLVIVVFLGNILESSHFATIPLHVSALLLAAAVAAACMLVILIGFFRVKPAVFWVLVLIWEVLFAWYAWLSPAAPFALHEIHTLEANSAAAESRVHYLRATALFVLLFAWFLSLPIARLRYRGRDPARFSPAR